MQKRPSFIVSPEEVLPTRWQYPESSESHGESLKLGKAAGLQTIGINILTLQPGERSSWPHAEEKEEEFVYVLAGTVDAWVDGHTYPMNVGDLAAFPAGTGICHTFINTSNKPCRLMVGGSADREDNRITYPFHPHRRQQIGEARWWHDAQRSEFGPDSGETKR